MRISDRPAHPTARQQIGWVWEEKASRYLQRQGLRVLKRRYRCRVGELDLVCLDGTTLVVVEVRARSSTSFVDATESVDGRKRQRLVRATRYLLMTHPQWLDYPVRFDVLSADDIDTKPRIRWIRNAFDANLS